ncbi:MAG TPA: hypothetical protein VN727_03345 [Candidatus Binatia bacterium]|nr:hypothetical protein [Candidatus Binatia bacterium]
MMRLAKTIATVLTVLVIALCLAGGALAQTNAAPHKSEPKKATAKPIPAAPSKTAEKPAAKPAISASLKPTPRTVSKTEPKPVTAKATPEKSASAKPVNAKPVTAKALTAKPIAARPAIAKTAPKPVAKTIAPEVAAKNKASVSPDETPAVSHADEAVAKRDPFVALVDVQKGGGGGPNLPPGKAGLVVATVRVDGTVKSGEDLLAVVSNPERHVYFVREGDHLYDGSVKKIDLDGVTFQEDSKDAFGKPIVREVTKRIYASAGEQQ